MNNPVTIECANGRKLIAVVVPKNVISYGIKIAAMFRGAKYLAYNTPESRGDDTDIDLKTNGKVALLGTFHYDNEKPVSSFDVGPFVGKPLFELAITPTEYFVCILNSHGIGYAKNPRGKKTDENDFTIREMYLQRLEKWEKAEQGVLQPYQQIVFIEQLEDKLNDVADFLGEQINKLSTLKNKNMENLEKSPNKNILTDQSNHSIAECLRELKYNRPAESQHLIDDLIDVVNGDKGAYDFSVLTVEETVNKNNTEWGISFTGYNPQNKDYFPMDKETAFRLVTYLKGE